MRADDPILSTLEDVVKHGSQERRVRMLGRITHLFVEGATVFTEEHIQFFDEIFNRLIAKIEAKARFELSVRLAGVANAPRHIVRQLANDDNASVASPVLQYSQRLEDWDLLDVAKSKSQQHLLAISNRNQIAESITDVLVRRGDRDVVRNVAGNSRARLSLDGFSTLVRKAEKDGVLAEKVGLRADIPEPLLRVLFMQATLVVQKRLFAAATGESQAKIRRVLAQILQEYGIDAVPRDEVPAQIPGSTLQSDSGLDETTLANLASGGHYGETMLGLANLCKIPIESIHRIMGNKRADPALVVCKALGFGWQTARAVILLQTQGHGMSAHSLEIKSRNFDKLSMSGSQDVMRLWHTMHDVNRCGE